MWVHSACHITASLPMPLTDVTVLSPSMGKHVVRVQWRVVGKIHLVPPLKISKSQPLYQVFEFFALLSMFRVAVSRHPKAKRLGSLTNDPPSRLCFRRHFLRFTCLVTLSSCSWLARYTKPISTLPVAKRVLTGLWALAYHTPPLPVPITVSIPLSTTCFGCRM